MKRRWPGARPPPMTTRPSTSEPALARASPATTANSSNACWAANLSPSRRPSPISLISSGVGHSPMSMSLSRAYTRCTPLMETLSSTVQTGAQAVDLAGGGVVALEQTPLAHHAGAEPGAEGGAQQVAVAPRAFGLLQQAVDVGQKAGDGFAKGEEVAVVADEHRQAELVFQRRTQWHTAAKHRHVHHITDDAVLVVGWPREGEADRHGFRDHQSRPVPAGAHRHLVVHAAETGDEQLQELVDGARHRGERHRRYDLTLALDGAEDQVGAAGVESEHDTRVFHIP